ncbi:MAG: MFS transporter [Gammaproteobacteria bacterium]|nr:MAG: MFS transporter [Gammaproteobacteria bacterium]
MYDFANSGYTTVVLTAIYNVYFISIIVGADSDGSTGGATFLWTLAIALANLLVIFSAPLLGAIADHYARKKRFLIVTTFGCVLFTGLLALPGPGEIWLAFSLVVLSNLMFSSGENIIAAFLPEIAPKQDMGRISGYGWSIGYFGGLLVLLLSLAYITWAGEQGLTAQHYVPVTMIMVAVVFAAAAMPTMIWLKERSRSQTGPEQAHYLRTALHRLSGTIKHLPKLRDLYWFMLSLTVYSSGIYTVVVLAAVYASEVMGFDEKQTIMLLIVVNLTAAIGAFFFGYVQDRLGSIPTLVITLLLWCAAILLVYLSTSTVLFWVAANLIGIAMGSCQSAGRAMIGQLAPAGRSAEFFGLWGLAVKLAAIIGPLSYGLIAYLTSGNHRIAIASTLVFFIGGLLILLMVNEKRGRQAALECY